MRERWWAIGGLALALAGCHSVQSVSPTVTPPEHVVERNYTLGEVEERSVGEAIVLQKDYYVRSRSTPSLVADRDFRLVGGSLGGRVDYAGTAGEAFGIHGATSVRGDDHLVMVVPQNQVVGFLVAPDGALTGKALNLQSPGVQLFYTYRVDPPDTRFEKAHHQEVLADRGFVHFELVYTGRSTDSIRLLYREYTPDDLIRPAFTQELTYEDGAPEIAFRGIRIRVEEATSSGIRYVVLADGVADGSAGAG